MLGHVVELKGDVHAVCGIKVLSSCSTLTKCGVGNGSMVSVPCRLRGGASDMMDIPGQWQCHVCIAQWC